MFTFQVHPRETNVKIDKLSNYPDTYTIKIFSKEPYSDSVTIFVESLRDLINFKNSVIQDVNNVLKEEGYER